MSVLDLGLFVATSDPGAWDAICNALDLIGWQAAPTPRRCTSRAAFVGDFFEFTDLRSYVAFTADWEAVRRFGTPNAGMVDGIRDKLSYHPSELMIRALLHATGQVCAPDRLRRLLAASEAGRTAGVDVERVSGPLPRAYLAHAILLTEGDVLDDVLDPACHSKTTVVIATRDAPRCSVMRWTATWRRTVLPT